MLNQHLTPITSSNALSASTLSDSAVQYAQNALSASTRRAYKSDGKDFARWCRDRGLEPLEATPENIGNYLSSLADRGLKVSTISRRCSAVRFMFELAGLPSPTENRGLRAVAAGIRRSLGVAPEGKAPLTIDLIRDLAPHFASTPIGVRDRAMILLGFGGAFRRSELSSLDLADITWREQGAVVRLRRSKTDQTGIGRDVPILAGRNPNTCPVTALQAWIQVRGESPGPLFTRVPKGGRVTLSRLSDRSVALRVKEYCRLAGLDASKYSGHSLRSGMCTSAAENGADLVAISEVTGHKSLEVLRGYVRSAKLFDRHALAGVL